MIRLPKAAKYLTAAVIVSAAIGVIFSPTADSGDSDMKVNKLTPQEKAVIINKGTEKPFSGIYYDNWEKGTYLCKRCDSPLYKSDSKFDSQCGWPSFDEEISGAVKRERDADGIRVEILCANCGAHLGHVFTGEGFTDKDTRHCVNSISMTFVADKKETKYEKAYFAGGCFWGVEYYFEKENGVISAESGYIGGDKNDPTYAQVCDGNTGHAEAVEVIFDPAVTSYEKLARLFFEIHDPTQVNRQGPDIGEQYRSAVFYTNEDQKLTALKLVGLLEDKGYDIATQVVEARKFWRAEDYHQDYYEKKNGTPYCHGYTKRF